MPEANRSPETADSPPTQGQPSLDRPPTLDPDAPCPPDFDPRVWQALKDMNQFKEQDENGVDVTLIEDMLRQPPIERIRRGDRWSREHVWIRKNYKRIG